MSLRQYIPFLIHKHRHDAAAEFSSELNKYFVENGIGRELHRGELRYRGPRREGCGHVV